MSTNTKILVVGATGATGKHVVRMLLEKGDATVVALARSKEKLMGLLDMNKDKPNPNLVVKEASIGDLSTEDFKELTNGCGSIVCCLGHNLTFKGMYKDGLFLQKAVKELTSNMPQGCRFVLMGSDGVAHPDGVTDPKRTRFERGILFLLRWLVPPHVDNEKTALYLSENSGFDWTVVRPGDLYNKEDETTHTNAEGYKIYDHPIGSLFGDNSTARSDVADFMVEVATMNSKSWTELYKHKMPVIYGEKEPEPPEQYKPNGSKD